MKKSWFQLCNGVKIELLQYWRSMWFYLALIFQLCCTAYTSFEYVSNGDYLGSIYNTQYIQIIALLLALFVGVLVSDRDKKCFFNETLQTIPNFPKYQALSKFISGNLICHLYWAVHIICLALFAMLAHISFKMFTHGVLYIILRGVLPTQIAYIIGLCIGSYIKTVWKYTVSVVIWLFISPMSYFIAQFLASYFGANNSMWVYAYSFLNLGTPISLDGPSVYGLIIEPPYWIHIFFFFILVVLWWIVCCFSSITKAVHQILSIGIFLLLALSILLTGQNEDLRDYFCNYPRRVTGSAEQLSNKYQKMYTLHEISGSTLNEDVLPEFPPNATIEATYYDVVLNTDLFSLTVDCTLTANTIQKTSAQSFTLYSSFSISKVYVNDIPANFTRSGDYINVFFPSELDKDSSLKIMFSYSGVSPYVYPANSSFLSLPSSFPWLPRIGMIIPPSYTNVAGAKTSLVYTPWIDSNDVAYHLSFKDERIVYTNLKKTSENEWHGDSKYGLSIASTSLMCCEEIDEIQLYFPESMRGYEHDLVALSSLICNERKKIALALGKSVYNDTSNKVVIFPTSPQNHVYPIFAPYVNEDTVLYFNGSQEFPTILSRYFANPENTAIEEAIRSYVMCNTPNLLAQSKEQVNAVLRAAMELWYYVQYYPQKDELISKAEGTLEIFCEQQLFFAEHNGKDPETLKAQLEYLSQMFHEISFSHNPEAGRLLFSAWYNDTYRGDFWDLSRIINETETVYHAYVINS